MRRLLLSLALLAAPAQAAAQGVLVAPHAVFVDHRTRSGWIQLYNTGTEPSEVSIEFLFGYPVTDSLGLLQLRTVERPDSTLPSAAAWIQAFPRRVVVPPQGRQTVRLLVTPPPGTRDGEYWSRVAITAKAGALPVTGADSTKGITVGLNLEIRSIIPLIYRKGAMTTGLLLDSLRAAVEPDSVVVRARLRRTGTGAWLGSARGQLVNDAGASVGTFDVPLSVYYAIDPRFTISRLGLPPGRYRVRMQVASERTDIPPEQLLPAASVGDSVTIRIR